MLLIQNLRSVEQNKLARQPALALDSDLAPAARLRALLALGACQLAPETPDGLMARMVGQAGFALGFVGLAGSALNRIGSPDPGLLTATELVDNAARAIGAGGLPTLVDAGSGFGNPINVRRTVAELVRAGAAGVLLSDAQDPPAHRGALAAVAPAEMVVKLQAACDVRGSSGCVLIAAVGGAAIAGTLDDVVNRAARYREAGADLIHVGMLRSQARAEALAQALGAGALSCSLAPDGDLDARALGGLGYRLALVPHCGLLAAVPAIEHTFAELARTGTVGHLRAQIADFRQFTDIAGLPQVQALEARYGVPEEQRTAL